MLYMWQIHGDNLSHTTALALRPLQLPPILYFMIFDIRMWLILLPPNSATSIVNINIGITVMKLNITYVTNRAIVKYTSDPRIRGSASCGRLVDDLFADLWGD